MSKNTEREEALFAKVLARPVAEREAFLAAACADDQALFARIRALIAAHEHGDSVLGSSAAMFQGSPEEKKGDRIDRYKLLQKIGEGGCGVVWMAEQEEPVRRRVALKIIKLGMDTKAVVARFEAERQALAMMDHAHIAKVLDGGATATGRPYFVMELVRGIAITRFCDEHNLTTKARLELFIQVCHAIQHAHQKGIIHRDIKPSNVLVALHDDVAVPAVIDFGIAKATLGRLTEATVVTVFEQFLGTPVYMSPEQAEYGALDVDTRSDIYSLGVLLYELLAGRPPFDPKTLQNSGLEQIRRVIREVEPPRPSASVRGLDAGERERIAKLRGAAPALLPALLHGDLDWIVMKALEKNRSRRYQTANALAADVQRHLAHEPVVASPPGLLYRSGKFVRRHRFGVTAAAAVTAALVAGIIASTGQAIRATRAERVANRERVRAVEARARADDLLNFLLGEFRAELEKVGKLDLLDRLNDRETAYFAAIDPDDLDDTSLAQQAKTLRQIGESRLKQGKYQEAVQAFSAAYERTRSLAARHPADAEKLFDRGQTEYWMGAAFWERRDYTATQPWWDRYLETAKSLMAFDPHRQRWQAELESGYHNLSALQMARQEFEAAKATFTAKLANLRRMLAATPGDLELQYRVTDTESWLGSLAERRGDFAEALARYSAEGRGLEALMRTEPNNRRWRQEWADSLSFQAVVLSITGQLGAAKTRLDEARKLSDELAAYDPLNRNWRAGAHKVRLQQAALLRAEGNERAAMEAAAAVRRELENVVTSATDDRGARSQLAVAWRIEAEASRSADPRAAAEAAAQAIALAEIALAGNPIDAEVAECARAHVVAATIAAANRDSAGMREHAGRALELLAPRVEKSNDWRLLDPSARALRLMGREQESGEIIKRLEGFGYRPLVNWPALPD